MTTSPASRDLSMQPEPPKPASPVSRMFLIIIFIIAVVMVWAFAGNAFSQGFGPPWRMHSLMERPLDPAAIEDRADKMVRHLSVELDATAEQQERLRGIVRSTVHDLLPLRDKMMSSRQRGRDLLTQSTIDRGALESLRADQMTLADEASRKIAQALGDAASVLTPEQRRKLADRIDAWRSVRHGWWHHG